MTEDTKDLLNECIERLEIVAAKSSITEEYEINNIIGIIEALVKLGE